MDAEVPATPAVLSFKSPSGINLGVSHGATISVSIAANDMKRINPLINGNDVSSVYVVSIASVNIQILGS